MDLGEADPGARLRRRARAPGVEPAGRRPAVAAASAPGWAACSPLRGRMEPEDHLVAARHGAVRALRGRHHHAGRLRPHRRGAWSRWPRPACAGRSTWRPSAVRRATRPARRGRASPSASPPWPPRPMAATASACRPTPRTPSARASGRALAPQPDLAGRPWATHLAESADEDPGHRRRRRRAGGGLRLHRRGSRPLAGGRRARARWSALAAAGALRAGLVAAHCVRLGDGDPALLAAAGVGVAHCPRSNEYLHCGRAPLPALREAGVPVGLGTDSPASGGDYDVRAEARACARMHGDDAGSPEALMALATIGRRPGARARRRGGEPRPRQARRPGRAAHGPRLPARPLRGRPRPRHRR